MRRVKVAWLGLEADGLNVKSFERLLYPYYSQARLLLNLLTTLDHIYVKGSYEMSYDVSKGPEWDRLPRTGRVLDIRLITGIINADPSLITKGYSFYRGPLYRGHSNTCDGGLC